MKHQENLHLHLMWKKYTSMPQNVDTNKTHMRSYICRTCHFQLKPNFSCVCCNRNIEQCFCKQYNMEDYDFWQYIVSRCLPDTSDEGDVKYICISCHKRLVEAIPENVSVPYFVNNRCVNAGAKFLKALQEKPQYVCICCHCLLFHKDCSPIPSTRIWYDKWHCLKKVYHIATEWNYTKTKHPKNIVNTCSMNGHR